MNNGGGVSYGCSGNRPTCNEVQELSEHGAAGRALFRVVTSPRRPPITIPEETTNRRHRPTSPWSCQMSVCGVEFQSNNVLTLGRLLIITIYK